MTDEALIVQQTRKIAVLEEAVDKAAKAANLAVLRLVAIGQPLNDNVLQFNEKQLEWAQSVKDLLDDVEHALKKTKK